jgi:hypothetical protein
MLMEWLEPKIQKRVQQVSEENGSNQEIGKFMDQFADCMEKLKALVPDEVYCDVVMEMESISNHLCLLSEDFAYRKGLLDGMALEREIKMLAENPKKGDSVA